MLAAITLKEAPEQDLRHSDCHGDCYWCPKLLQREPEQDTQDYLASLVEDFSSHTSSEKHDLDLFSPISPLVEGDKFLKVGDGPSKNGIKSYFPFDEVELKHRKQDKDERSDEVFENNSPFELDDTDQHFMRRRLSQLRDEITIDLI